MRTLAQEQAEMRKRMVMSVDSTPHEAGTVAGFYANIFLPWLTAMVQTGQKSHATKVTYERYWISFLSDHCGTTPLRDYSPKIGAQFLQTIRRRNGKPYGERTIKHIHSTASGIFTQAVERELIDHNPWRDIKVSSVPFLAGEQGEAFTEAEVERLIARLNDLKVACVLGVGLWAGLRPSEQAALRWESVDLTKATMKIDRAFVYGKETGKTKTGKQRIVPFLDKLSPLLTRWWEKCGCPSSGLVFPNGIGGPMNISDLSGIIREGCDVAEVKWKGMYALRRGCGTLLVQDGWSCEAVAQFLGNTQGVVWKHYFCDKECELAASARERSRAASLPA